MTTAHEVLPPMKSLLRSPRSLLLLLAGAAGCVPDGPATTSGGDTVTSPASPLTRLVRGRDRKVLVDAKDGATRRALARATRAEWDYGTFVLLQLDEEAAGAEALRELPVRFRDDYDVVRLEGRPLDAFRPELVYAALPEGLANRRLEQALSSGAKVPEGLYLVQLAGPSKDEWLEALEGDGLELVTYMPENTYVVWASGEGLGHLPRALERHRFVQLVGDYEPAFKIDPALVDAPRGEKVEVLVQVFETERLKGTLARLGELAATVHGDWPVGQYRNVHLSVDSARIGELARIDDVFSIERRTERTRLDEAQGQILAGALSAGVPTGPGYLSFLAGKGFGASQFQTFAVHVVDDSHALTGVAQHPDLPASRVAFQNNPTFASSTQGGHGFLNSHIVGGFNDGSGGAVEDANLYNYGLGIAPWARVGVSDIFGFGFSTPTAWENTAYTAGARISSNSWGFVSVYDYDANAQEYDVIVRDAQAAVAGAQQLTVVFAAGNDGPGANTIGSPGTAKNVITVGASENVRQTGTDGCVVTNTGANNAEDVIDFSSRGPVNTGAGDGRIKPELIAPGTHIQAGVPQGGSYNGTSVCNQYWPTGQTLYGWSSGTSHSCPAVAGAAALVYQDFLNQSLAAPSPAMIKAFLMSSATHMTGVFANDTLPSNVQGMGRVDLARAFDRVPRLLTDQTVVLGATGETHVVSGVVSSSALPFRVTLAWTDVAGPTTGAPWVNDLNLTVTVGGNTYLGNVFSGASSITGGAAATRDNAESVFLPAGTSGAFTVTVSGANIAGNGVPGNADATDQDFALVIYNGTTAVTPILGVAPVSMSFTGVAGGASPGDQALSITNNGAGTLSWTASSDQPWLGVSSSAGTAPSTIDVSASTAGLSPGTYTGNVTLSAPGATGAPFSVAVTLTVTDPPSLVVSPASLAFTADEGGASPASQSLLVSNGGGGTFAFTATTDQPWLSVTGSGTAGQSAVVSADTSGLTAGSYSANVTVTATGIAGSPQIVPVSLVVAPPPPPVIVVAPASLAFSGTVGGADPAGQLLAIDNSASSAEVAWTAVTDQPWLTLTAYSGVTPTPTLAAQVGLTGLAAGTYTGNVIITVAGATNSPLSVPVSLAVAAPGTQLLGNPGFETAQSPWFRSGAATYTANGPSPHGGTGYVYFGDTATGPGSVAQQLAISGAYQSLTLTYWFRMITSETVTFPTDRLFVEVLSSTGALLQTLATYSNLNAATYPSYTQVSFDLSAYVGQTIRIQFRTQLNPTVSSTFFIDDVTLVGGSPVIGLSPSSLSFAGDAGGPSPASQVLSISNTGVGTLSWTASTNAAWLSVAPASGSAPGSATVSVNSAGLAAGTYNGSVTISGNANNSPATVPVTLTLSAGTQPVIAVAPAALSFAATEGGASPAAQALSITNAGAGTLAFSVTTDQAWLSASAGSGTAPASVDVTASVAGLAAGTYSGNVTISAVGATNSPVVVPVTLVVAGAGTQLVANGGFEGGSATPWARFGTGQTFSASGGTPHGGAGYMILGNANSAPATIAQQFSIPAGASNVTLSYWLQIPTADTAVWAADSVFVELRSTAGALLQTVATHSNLNAAAFASYTQQSFNVTGFAGQTVRLQFRVQTNGTNVTVFNLDDVSMISQ